MIKPIEENRYLGRDLSTFSTNLGLPRHRWYEFKEGFSETLVREAITEQSTGKKKLRILDPFSGSGTTLVTAGRTGHTATGIEVNPFLSFASQAKCASGEWERGEFYDCLESVLSETQHEVVSSLEGQSTFTETPGSEKWLFNRSVLRGFTALDTVLNKIDTYRDPLRLALFASLMDCCNARRDGKCLRYRKGWTTLGFNSESLRRIFSLRATMVFNDVTNHPFREKDLTILQGDAREQLTNLEAKQYDLVVTSPPYLNSFDYSDVYRPELFVGGFVKNNEELRQIRLKTIRSHVQVSWQPATNTSSPMLTPILKELSDKRLWDRRLPDMVQSYFEDMSDILRELARVVRPAGQAWIVVSTSAYGGVEIPVDLLLADVGTQNGWCLKGVYVLRQLRASGQHYARGIKNSRPHLRESLIILQR
jgi:DNA modification methylase